LRILNVVSVLSAKEGGGNAERVTQLSRELSSAGVECTVITLAIGNPHSRKSQLGTARLKVLPCRNHRFQIPDLRAGSLEAIVSDVDVIHLMGYWSLLGVAVATIAKRKGIPYVISPAGALPLFGRSRWIKWAFNTLIGRKLVRSASGWIAVTASELPDFERYGVDTRKVEVIPNGVVESDFDVAADALVELPSAPFILFMGRLNSIKGPDLLLDAFIEIAGDFPRVELVFAGPDEGLGASLRQRVEAAGLTGRVHFLGFVSGHTKTAAYRGASLLVVPSRIEAMSIVAVEAGVCGTPVLMTDQCGLEDVKEVAPDLVVPVSARALADGLTYALGDLERLRSLGLVWQEIVRKRFLWSDIGRRFSSLLEGLARKAL
jgi:glycosyltransferase involved in cell wall biosynthesis